MAAKKKLKAGQKLPAKKAVSHNEMVLKNYMEDIAKRNVADQQAGREDICKCSRCTLDMTAYALNHLPPKYVATDRGHIYTKLQEMEDQFNADVTREVFKAIEFVKAHKRHS
jgi:competence protein ComFB